MAASDPKLADSEVAGAVREYLVYRDRAGAEAAKAGSSTLAADKFVALRQWLYAHGVALVDAVPEFGRVWDQLLSSEVD